MSRRLTQAKLRENTSRPSGGPHGKHLTSGLAEVRYTLGLDPSILDVAFRVAASAM